MQNQKKELEKELREVVEAEKRLLSTLQNEKRNMSDDEKGLFDGFETRVARIRTSLNELKDTQMENEKKPVVEITRGEHENEQGQYVPFKSLGEQLQAVVRSSIPGCTIDERLTKIRAASGLSEGVDSDGGFLVQTDFMVDLVRDVYNSGVVASKCRRVPILGDSLEFVTIDETSRADGYRLGGVRAYWRSEAGTVTSTKPKFTNLFSKAESLMAIGYVTDGLLADAPALGAILGQGFAEEMAFVLDDAIINGDGAGKPLGVMNAPCLVTVAKESGQTADTIVQKNVSKMRNNSMYTRGLTRAEWFVNQECLEQLEAMYIALGSATGLPVFSPAGAFNADTDSLYKRPINVVEQCQKLGDAGDILFCDFSQYLLLEKGGIDAQQSIHVRFLYGESTLRWTLRTNGQPVWPSSVTPANATSGVKRSPFVALAARA